MPNEFMSGLDKVTYCNENQYMASVSPIMAGIPLSLTRSQISSLSSYRISLSAGRVCPQAPGPDDLSEGLN